MRWRWLESMAEWLPKVWKEVELLEADYLWRKFLRFCLMLESFYVICEVKLTKCLSP